MKITNEAGIPLALAVWLVHDEYDYINAENYISATALMKPPRQIIIPPRMPEEAKTIDVEDMISSSLGHSIHDSMEKAWAKGYQRNLAKLGYPQSVIDRVLVNPTDAELDAMEDPIPVYLEQRMFRKIKVNGKVYIIGGKYDAITDGIVNDTKSTSAYSWVFGGKDSDYRRQGSIYRWLDAEGYDDIECDKSSRFRPRITEDYMRVNFVFTDWQKAQAKANKGYPQRRVAQKEIVLESVEETEQWIRERIMLLEKLKNVPEDRLPECTPEELWQSEPTYKYFKDPAKAKQKGARATRNFNSDLAAAHAYMAEQGGIGTIVTIPGEPKRCGYCPAFDACTQRERLGL